MVRVAVIFASDPFSWNERVWRFAGKGFVLVAVLIVGAAFASVRPNWPTWVRASLLVAPGLVVMVLTVGTLAALRRLPYGREDGFPLYMAVVLLTLGLPPLILGARVWRRRPRERSPASAQEQVRLESTHANRSGVKVLRTIGIALTGFGYAFLIWCAMVYFNSRGTGGDSGTYGLIASEFLAGFAFVMVALGSLVVALAKESRPQDGGGRSPPRSATKNANGAPAIVPTNERKHGTGKFTPILKTCLPPNLTHLLR